ncbi:MAG: alpha/beta fold hydrolase [Verrucomicrobiota bacterium]
MLRLPLAATLCLCFFVGSLASTSVSAAAAPTSVTAAASPADTRAAFLKLLDRPRVALAPVVGQPVEKDGLVEIPFLYASDADNRVPGILIKSATPPATKRRPVVVAVHGTGGNKESQRKLLSDLARAGFVGVAIDGRYHGARVKGPNAPKNAQYMAAIAEAWQKPGQAYPFYYDTAWDLMRLIDYLGTRDDVDPRRIALWGFSKGGIETYLTAAADSRVAAAIPCIGLQSFRWALENDSWQSRVGTIQAAFDGVAKQEGVAKPDAAFVRRFYDRVAPSIYDKFDGPAMVALIAPRPMLSINGDSDPRTPLPGLALCTDAAKAAYAAAGAPDKFTQIIQPNTGHKVNPDSIKFAQEWLIRELKP